MCEDLVVDGERGVYYLQAAVHEAEGADGGVWAGVLCYIWCAVLGGEGAVFGDPGCVDQSMFEMWDVVGKGGKQTSP